MSRHRNDGDDQAGDRVQTNDPRGKQCRSVAGRTINMKFTIIAGQLAATILLFGAGSSAASATTILFVGNSFTYGEPAGATGPTVQGYQPGTVNDLNKTNVGGVPALFKQFTIDLGLDYTVSLETVGGTGLDYHYTNKLGRINQAWDKVVLQSYSTLDASNPGNPGKLITYTGLLADALHTQNPAVDIYLDATWSRADLTYKTASPWLGQPIDAMEKSVQAGYEQAAASTPYVKGVIKVGAAWNSAFDTGLADLNPYDGIDPGKINLWAPEGYHASPYGYYLEALMEFGQITGLDPRLLGANEAAAASFRFTPEQTSALQDIAYSQLNNVPEPSTLMLMASAVGALAYGRRRNRGASAA
jgi:hypothetical protein